MLNRKTFLLFLALLLSSTGAFADEAVFGDNQIQEINLKPEVEVEAPVRPAVEHATTVQTPQAAQTQQPASGALKEENFKNAVSNLESAQVDVREQLATYSAIVQQKQAEFNLKKAELNAAKKKYKALDKQMKSIDKMKKMLNSNINQQ